MKHARFIFGFLICALMLTAGTAFAQGTAFTYQGRLNDNGAPANGSYDFIFSLFGPSTGAGQVGVATNIPAVAVSNGLFMVELNFGGNFPGTNRWLETGVRTNGFAGPFTLLAPRQKITATPYAMMAGSASNLLGVLPAGQLSGTLGSAQLSGTYSAPVLFNNAANDFMGNGAGLANVNAATLQGLSKSNFWQTGGNNGTSSTNGNYLGTADNQPLDIRVNGQRTWRSEPTTDAPNVIGGARINSVGTNVEGATIGGGGSIATFGAPYANRVEAAYGTIAGGLGNLIRTNALESSILGGNQNTIEAARASVGGGLYNSIQANSFESVIGGGAVNSIGTNSYRSVIGGGFLNVIGSNAIYATIGGGLGNVASGRGSVVGGGSVVRYTNDTTFYTANSALGISSVVPGGAGNTAAGNFSLAAGFRAGANHDGAFVWADSQNLPFASTTNDEFSIRARNGVRIQSDVGIHLNASDSPMIVRDWDVFATNAPANKAGIGRWGLFMEQFNLVLGIPSDDIPGRNFQVGKYSTNGTYTALLTLNQAGLMTLGGGIAASNFNAPFGQPLVFRVNGQAVERFELTSDTINIIAGYGGNLVQSGLAGATISGGGTVFGNQPNVVTHNGHYGTIAGGYANAVTNYAGAVLGGGANLSGGAFSGVGAGLSNSAFADYSWIGGGRQNRILPGNPYAIINGGSQNLVSGNNAAIVGGSLHTNSAPNAVIGGGVQNSIQAGASSSTIAGGANNSIQTNAFFSTIAGGVQNQIMTSATSSTIGGGNANSILPSAQYATIPGGNDNEAATLAFAAGYHAKAIHQGAFVWADSQNADFSSTSNNQFLVRAAGGVGINKSSPTEALDVNGNIRANGLVRLGSETGTAQAPLPAGLVMRRINSTVATSNSVIARTDDLTIERDGSFGGIILRYPASSVRFTIAAMGMNAVGASVNFYQTIVAPGAPGVVQLYSDAQNVVHFQCSFGNTYHAGNHLSRVTLSRAAGDNFWSGDLVSTVNQ